MSPTAPRDILERVVEMATRAPSIHNTQPWRWRSTREGLELRADRSRQLVAADPLGRNLVISCGAALHHARLAASTLGWDADVSRLPDGSDPDLLARLTFQRGEPSASAETDSRNIMERCTDRRRFTSWPVPQERLQHLTQVAAGCGTHAVPLTEVSVRYRTDLLVARAGELQSEDDLVTSELRAWARSSVDGIPAAILPAEPQAMTSAAPELRIPDGLLPDNGREVEGSDALIMIFGAADTPGEWLAAGEGLSALWLTASGGGLSVVPLSQVIEVDETRSGLRHDVLGDLGRPLVLVRIGWQAISRADLVRTSRRPLSEVLDPA